MEANDGVAEWSFRPKARRPTAETEWSIPGSELVRQKGFEPLAYCLEGSCSILLSYWRTCADFIHCTIGYDIVRIFPPFVKRDFPFFLLFRKAPEAAVPGMKNSARSARKLHRPV